jgi:PPOX class probable F420-dependent enzyme
MNYIDRPRRSYRIRQISPPAPVAGQNSPPYALPHEGGIVPVSKLLSMANAKETYRDLLESKQLIVMATVNKDGSPQTSPVWFHYKDDFIWINSAKGRLKDRNLRERPVFSGSIVDPQNPYRYVEVRGEVVEITEEGADDHIDFLAKRYLGVDSYPFRNAQETRVIYKIRPTHFTGMG